MTTRKILSNEELAKQYEITIASNEITSKVDEEAEKRQKTYVMDGFRAGKVPVEVIKKREGTALFFTVAENLINSEIFKIIDEEKLELSCEPKVEMKNFKENEDVTFTVLYNLLPTIPSFDLKNVKVDSYNIEVQPNEIEESVEKIMSNFKKWTKVDREAKMGDAVKIDFEGKINGEKFAGGEGKDFQLELGSKSFIDNFEEQLVGKKAGDKVLVKVKFPEDYHSSAVAGKQAEFDVVINEVLEASKEELTNELTMKNFGIETVEKFKELVQKELENSYKTVSKNKIKEVLFDKLMDLVDFTLPENLVQEQFEALKTRQEKENNKDKKEEKIDEDKIQEEAKKAVKLGLLLANIGKMAQVSVSENEVNSAIMQNAMRMKGYEQMMIDFYKKNKQAVAALKEELMEEKIIDYIIENITKNEIKTTFKDFEAKFKK